MRVSVVLASLCAALSVASPIRMGVNKKDYVYDITTEIVYVTVTMGFPLPSAAPTSDDHTTTVKLQHTVVVVPTEEPVPTTSSTPPPPPPPPSTTSTSTSTTPVPAPEPTPEVVVVQAAPAATSTTPVPAPVETTPAPVVQAAVVVATTPAAAAAAASPTDYNSAAVWHHNMHRANHTAGDLTWSADLAAKALVLAKTCVFAHDMTVGGGGYGQNLAAYGSSDLSTATTKGAVADAITNQWYYGEANNMPYGVDSPNLNGPEFLHFSAMLWKDTTTVGCATVTCAAGTIFPMASLYTVCNYASEGNIIGEFASQVTRPIGTAPITASVSS